MKGEILVAGGYGNVGQTVCRDLGERFPGKVVAAGRSFEKARQFCQSTAGKVIPRRLDVFIPAEWREALAEVSLVIMCLDQSDTAFLKACLEGGIQYVDITASQEFLSQAAALDPLARERGATLVLGVGLSPGLTNLLVKHSAAYLDRIDTAEIYILLGLGERHGRAAVAWTIDNLSSVFSVMENGCLKRVKSLTQGKKTMFPGERRPRTAYRFGFVDQHIVPKTLGIRSCSTRLCFDSAVLTRVLALARRLGVLNLLKLPWFRDLTIGTFEHLHWGTDRYVVQVVARGTKNGTPTGYRCSVSGSNEGQATGKIPPLVVDRLYSGKAAAGVHYLEELFSVEEVLGGLTGLVEFSAQEVSWRSVR